MIKRKPISPSIKQNVIYYLTIFTIVHILVLRQQYGLPLIKFNIIRIKYQRALN